MTTSGEQAGANGITETTTSVATSAVFVGGAEVNVGAVVGVEVGVGTGKSWFRNRKKPASATNKTTPATAKPVLFFDELPPALDDADLKVPVRTAVVFVAGILPSFPNATTFKALARSIAVG